MAGTAIVQLRESGSGSSDPTYRRLVRVYMVTVDTRTDDSTHVNTYLDGFFAFGSDHPNYSAAKHTYRDIRRMGDVDSLHWRCELIWETPTGTSGTEDPNPLDRDPVIVWSAVVDQRTLPRDYVDEPIVNTVGVPFDNPPLQTYVSFEVSYTRNEASIPWTFFAQDNKFGNFAYVNSDSFTLDGKTIGAKHALMWIESAPKLIENGTTYYAITYKFLLRASAGSGSGGALDDSTWRARVANYSYYYALSSTDFRSIKDDDGAPIARPWPMDENGAMKTSWSDLPYISTFQMHMEVAFSSLSFS